MKRVLIVSPHFPPVNAPDCQRVRMSLPYYREFGWEPEVLAVAPHHRPDWLDESLAASLPADVPVHRCGALRLGATSLVGIHNLGLRSAPFVNRAALRLLQSRSFDLIFFSTTQYLVTPLALIWRRRHPVPYVIDLQDPWRSDYYQRPGAPRPPGGWKYQFARFTSWAFEERTFRQAAGFISVSPHYLRDLAARYPWFQARPRAVIPFGGPQADFEHLRQHPRDASLPRDGRRHWVAAGSLGPAFGHSLRVLFAGLRRLRDTTPALADRIRLHFVGTSYAPSHQLGLAARPVAEAYGVGDLVEERPARIGYLDSLALLQAADGLMLLGSDDLAYSPSKIYPYLMSGIPVLALAHHGSLLATILERLGGAHVVRLLTPGRMSVPPVEVADYFRNALSAEAPGLGGSRLDPRYTARTGARRQCEFFDRVTTAQP